MRHFRIKEIIEGKNKEYIIQYTKTFLFFRYWKRYNKLPYKKYEDAVLEAKKVIDLSKDYTKNKKNKTINYHYIDAFKLKREVTTTKFIPKKERDEKSRYNRSRFVPKNIQK